MCKVVVGTVKTDDKLIGSEDGKDIPRKSYNATPAITNTIDFSALEIGLNFAGRAATISRKSITIIAFTIYKLAVSANLVASITPKLKPKLSSAL